MVCACCLLCAWCVHAVYCVHGVCMLSVAFPRPCKLTVFYVCFVPRSAMIADYMFWLCGGSEHCVSKLIKLYWQVNTQAPVREEERVPFLEAK